MMLDHSDFSPDFAGASEWAGVYRAARWQVVPGRHPQEDPLNWKRPALKSWDEYKHELADEVTFARWYGQNGTARSSMQMGVITGSASSGLFMVDLDTYKSEAPAQWWLGLLALHNDNSEFETPRQRTGGGGLQMFFRAPAGRRVPTFRTSLGVDVRGQGGYCVLPPSVHDSGRLYEWLPGCAPWEVEVVDAPEWLLDAIDRLHAETGGGGETPAIDVTRAVTTDTFGFEHAGKVTDGRDGHMLKVTMACLAEYLSENGALPSPQELFDAAWPIYARTTDLSRPGHGAAELVEKCNYAVLRATSGAMGSWDEIIGRHRELKASRPFDAPAADPAAEFAAAKSRIELIAWDDLPEVNVAWLIKDFLPAGGFGALYGKPGSYKSFVALYLAACVASGMAAFGRETTAGDVIYIAGEGGSGLKKRKDAFMRRYGLPPGTRVHFIRAQLNLRSTDADVDALIAILRERGLNPALIIVDTLARAFAGGNENAPEDMGAFIRQTGRLQEAMGGPAVLVVHHTGKDEARGMRGHSSLLGALDTELEVVKVSADESPDRVGQITVTKQKDGEDGFKLGYRMELVTVSDVTGEGSLVVVPDDAVQVTPAATTPQFFGNQELMFKALKRAIEERGETVASNEIPPETRCVTLDVWQIYFRQMSGLNEDTARKSAERNVPKMVSKGFVGVWGKHVWTKVSGHPPSDTPRRRTP